MVAHLSVWFHKLYYPKIDYCVLSDGPLAAAVTAETPVVGKTLATGGEREFKRGMSCLPAARLSGIPLQEKEGGRVVPLGPLSMLECLRQAKFRLALIPNELSLPNSRRPYRQPYPLYIGSGRA
jgi:hypothetical protein